MKLVICREIVEHDKPIKFNFIPWFVNNDGFEIGGT